MKPRCPACRTRRATVQPLFRHLATTGHKACDCGGLHYPHRPRSRGCYDAPWDAVFNEPRAVLTLGQEPPF